MSETTTATALPGAATAAALDVRIEDDASPIVRLIGRTLRDSARVGNPMPALREAAATVVVRSHDTPQVATVVFGDDGVVTVHGGAAAGSDAAIVVDVNGRFTPAAGSVGDADLVAAVLDALSPPLPDWRTAAESFWRASRGLPGVPDVLVAVTEGPEGLEQAVVGDGETQYLIAGAPDALAGVFSGADDLFATLATGALGIRGTMSQLSVMIGASWKVRYDV